MKTSSRGALSVLITFLALMAVVSLAPGQTGQGSGEKKSIPYPLTTCLVSGESLTGGDMGDPVSLVHDGQEFKFCCKSCIGKFNKDPQKYHDMLNQEIIKSKKASYSLTTCVVSGEKLDADSIDYVYEGQLVRFCCKKCIKDFQADPAKYMTKIQAAQKGK